MEKLCVCVHVRACAHARNSALMTEESKGREKFPYIQVCLLF